MKHAIRNPQSALRTTNYELPALVLLTALAAFFRFYRVGEIPPGLQYDEAYKLLDILPLFRGEFSIFFPANEGREPLYFYLATVFFALFGDQAVTVRVTSAVIGTLTIPVIYGFTRALFRSTRVAFFAAALSAFSVWHLFYSRHGTRNILVVLVTTLALWFFWYGITRRRRRDYALAGVFTALATYTYLTGRLLPVIFVALTLLVIRLDRPRARFYLTGLIFTGAVACAVFLPLGIYYWQNPSQFSAHAQNLSVLDPRVGRGEPLAALLRNIAAVAGMFLAQGDREFFRNIPNRPVFDPITGALFGFGVALLVRALFLPRRDFESRLRAALIALALVVFLAVSVLSDDPPVFTRTIAALPFVMILPAWALAWMWEHVSPRVGSRARIAISTIGLTAFAALTFKDYFLDFGASPALYYAFGVEKLDGANWVNQNARGDVFYIAPLWMRDSTFALTTRNAGVHTLETKDTVVLPSRAVGKNAVFVYPLEQEKKAAKMGERLGALGTRAELIGSNGKAILIYYRVRAQDLPDPADPLRALSRGGDFLRPRISAAAKWGDRIELLGYALNPEGPVGRNLTVDLFVRGLQKTAEDYTFSIKVRDAQDRAWGQEDKWLGNNSYPTTHWEIGDVIIEKFYPGLHACAPAGEYRVTAEVYDPKTMRTLSAEHGSVVSLGVFSTEASAGNRLEDMDPEHIVEKDVAPQARLIGYTLTPNELTAGEPFALALYWRGANNATPRDLSLRLRDSAGRAHALAQRTIALPEEGRGLCAYFDLRAPSDTAKGAGVLLVNEVVIGSVNIK